jgi:hypothetical protein
MFVNVGGRVQREPFLHECPGESDERLRRREVIPWEENSSCVAPPTRSGKRKRCVTSASAEGKPLAEAGDETSARVRAAFTDICCPSTARTAISKPSRRRDRSPGLGVARGRAPSPPGPAGTPGRRVAAPGGETWGSRPEDSSRGRVPKHVLLPRDELPAFPRGVFPGRKALPIAGSVSRLPPPRRECSVWPEKARGAANPGVGDRRGAVPVPADVQESLCGGPWASCRSAVERAHGSGGGSKSRWRTPHPLQEDVSPSGAVGMEETLVWRRPGGHPKARVKRRRRCRGVMPMRDAIPSSPSSSKTPASMRSAASRDRRASSPAAAAVPEGAVSGRQRRQGRNPACSAAAALGKKRQFAAGACGRDIWGDSRLPWR